MKIDELYFGIKLVDFNTRKLQTYNLFTPRIKRNVAIYAKDKSVLANHSWFEPLSFCFGDMRGRTEYEFYVSDVVDGKEQSKADAYEMYVKPNEEYLMSLVDSISEYEGKKWLKNNPR